MPTTASVTSGQHLIERLGLPSDCLLGPKPLPQITDPIEAVRDALARPLAFPPLTDATAPGDRGAVALARGVPRAEQVAVGAVRAMVDAGIEPADIAVVLETPLPTVEKLRHELFVATGVDVRIEVHQAGEETACAMLGVTAAGRALRINRTLTDADVMLPIGVARPRVEAEGSAGRFAALTPGFSDEPTQRRFRKSEVGVSAKRSKAHRAEVDEAGWLMGVMFTLQTTAGPDDSVLGVFAGEPQAAANAAAQLATDAWTVPADHAADLVIAVIGSHPHGNSWERVEHALLAAEAYLRRGGAIVVCTDALDRPRGALRRLVDDQDYPRLEAQLRQVDLPYAGPALQLATVLEHSSVYLRSPLPVADAESLGMTAVDDEVELERLVGRYQRCLVLDQADRLVPLGSDG